MCVYSFFITFARFLWSCLAQASAANQTLIHTLVKLTLFVQTDDILQEPTGETRGETMEKGSEKSSEKSSEKIIDIIKQSPKISAKEISIVLGISSRGVEKQIKNLREQGILRRIGPDKGGHWEVVE